MFYPPLSCLQCFLASLEEMCYGSETKVKSLTFLLAAKMSIIPTYYNYVVIAKVSHQPIFELKFVLTLSVPVSYQQPIFPYITYTKYDIW